MEFFRRLNSTSKLYLFLGLFFIGFFAVESSWFIYKIGVNSAASPKIETDQIPFVVGLISYTLAITMLGFYMQSETKARLRGLTRYVEQLRAYTVPRVDDLIEWASTEDAQEMHETKQADPPEPEVPTEPAIERPLGTRERDTLLTIIAALAKEARLQIDQPGKAALFIEGLTNQLGSPVSKRAIEEHLKKIPNALETRMK